MLTVNGGSSSLKSTVYEAAADGLRPQQSVSVQRIGSGSARVRVRAADGRTLDERDASLPGLPEAMRHWLDWLRAHGGPPPDGVGHRIVHGGPEGDRPRRIAPGLLQALRDQVPLAPDHLPGQLEAVAAVEEAWPGVPQIACFDTAFHRTLPARARRYPLPRALEGRGIVRYGFHGLSYEYILSELRGIDPVLAGGRIVVAHLGGGASMAAIAGGASLDTTMGLTPAGGLMMGTRCGDLDPGVLVRLMQLERLTPEGLNDLVNHRAGLLGVSETSADMQQLLGRMGEDARAADAVTLFCYVARKWLGALLAALGGADGVVFTGGIGEHAPRVRAAICEGLAFAGIRLDAARNEANAPVISADGAPVAVRVIATNEELMIARHTVKALREAT